MYRLKHVRENQAEASSSNIFISTVPSVTGDILICKQKKVLTDVGACARNELHAKVMAVQ